MKPSVAPAREEHNAMLTLPQEPINRRRLLTILGGAGATALLTGATDALQPVVDAATCVATTPTVTEGPYWVDEKLFRSDIRTDPSTGVARAGIPLTLSIAVQNQSG